MGLIPKFQKLNKWKIQYQSLRKEKWNILKQEKQILHHNYHLWWCPQKNNHLCDAPKPKMKLARNEEERESDIGSLYFYILLSF